MRVKSSLASYVAEQLASLGRISSRAIFGGVGIFVDERLLGIVMDEKLYLHTDKSNLDDYVRAACRSSSRTRTRSTSPPIITKCRRRSSTTPSSSRSGASGRSTAAVESAQGQAARRHRALAPHEAGEEEAERTASRVALVAPSGPTLKPARPAAATASAPAPSTSCRGRHRRPFPRAVSCPRARPAVRVASVSESRRPAVAASTFFASSSRQRGSFVARRGRSRFRRLQVLFERHQQGRVRVRIVLQAEATLRAAFARPRRDSASRRAAARAAAAPAPRSRCPRAPLRRRTTSSDA